MELRFEPVQQFPGQHRVGQGIAVYLRGDSGPGQAHGNKVNLNGGVWHEMTVSG